MATMRESRTAFKNRIRQMSTSEQKQELKSIQQTLMAEWNASRKGTGQFNVRELRKRIAIIKTILHEPGFHYHPRN